MTWSKSGGKVGLTLAAFLLYAVAFAFLHPHLGEGAAPLSVVPVFIGSWYFGIGGGIFFSFLAIGFNTALFYAMGESGLDVLLHSGSVGSVALVATGLGAGYAHTLFHRHEREIVARRRAEGALRQSNRELQLLNRLVVAASSQHDPRAVLNIACRELVQVLDLMQAGAALLDESGERLRVVAQYSRGEGNSGVGEVIPVAGNPATQEVVSQKRPLVIDDAQHDPRMAPVHPLMRKYGISSIMLLPLLVNDVVVGTIGLDTDRRRNFSADDVRLAATVAAAVGPVLERARLHAQTRIQARQMKQVVESVPVGLLLLNRDRQVALANSLARNYLQKAGTYDDDARLLRFGDRPMTALLQAPAGDRPFHEVATGAGGQQTIFEVRAAIIEDSGWALVLNDVTEVREQARQLQAQERLAAVGQLSAGIAHDFNNILNVMTIYLQLLAREPLPVSALERVQILDAEAHRAAHLVQQMLDFSRKAVLRRQTIDLASFVRERVALLERTLPDKVTLQLAQEPGTYLVEVDATRLQQALHNLLTNAQEAMPDGGALCLSLSCLGSDATPPLPDMRRDDWICLMVNDNGCGIEPQHLQYIFEPFFTTKGPGEGSGLGLAQVYGTVRQHGGFVDVKSQVGRGTTVSIYLPAV